ncbi:MAG: hypothetical protein GX671_01155, partial [Clostridiales bacterium]|nr:hypothetical protein [Clostridiales bacterium]
MNKGRVCVRLSVLIVSVLLVLTTSYSQVFAEDQCPAGGDHEYTITVVRHAASDAEGLRRYTCNKCDYSYTESIPATGHRWGSWNVAKAATKSAEGLRCRVCMNDPDHVEYASISVLPAGPKPNIGGGVILGGNQTRTGDQPGAGTDNDKKSKHKPGGNGGGNEGGGSGSDSIVP